MVWRWGIYTYHNTVIPSEDGKLIKANKQIPPRSYVPSYEDAESQDGEGVHELAAIVGSLPCDRVLHIDGLTVRRD